MKKKLVAIFMAAVMVAGMLVGCGSSASDEPADNASQKQETPEQTGEAGEEKPAEAESAETESAEAESGETYLIKYATVRSSEHGVEKLVQEYFDTLTEKSGGRLQFECYFDGSIGSAREIAEACAAGTIDAYWGGSGDLSVYAPVAEILTNPPFVYKDAEHAERVLDAVWDDVVVLINQADLMPLYHSYQGTRQLICRTPVNSLADLKGVKKRTVNSEYFMGLFAALGAEPQAIDLSELYTALQTGVCDAGGGDLDMIYDKAWYEVIDNITMYNAICVQGIPVMNLDKFNSLPEDLQELMIAEGKIIAHRGTEEVSASEQASLKKLEDAGCNIIYLEDDARSEFKDAVAEYAKDYAASLGDDVLAVYEKMIAVE